MGYRSGTDRAQIIMPASIDEYVEHDNPVRVIDACVEALDLVKLRFTKSTPAADGSPAYNPKDMLGLYLYGYMNRTRSSRQLERAAKINTEVIWLMKGLQPDYRTIARFRHENAGVMKKAFKAANRIFEKMDLFGKEAVSIDGSKFKANNSPKKAFTKEELKKKDKELDEQIRKYLAELDRGDAEEAGRKTRPDAKAVADALQKLQNRSEEVKRLLEEMDAEEMTSICTTDKDSRKIKAGDTYIAGYNPIVAVDVDGGLIASYETTNHSNDQGMLTEVAVQAKEAMNAEELQAFADAGFDNPSDMAKALSEGMTPVVCSQDKIESIDICVESDKNEPPEKHENGKCVYNEKRNIVICPMGKALYPRSYSNYQKAGVYCNPDACKNCPCRCTVETYKKFYVRMKLKLFSKEYDDNGLKLKQIRIRYASYQEAELRRCASEHGFGIIKEPMGFRVCLTRGFDNVDAEFALIFTAYNIKRAIALLGVRNLLKKVRMMGVYPQYLLLFRYYGMRFSALWQKYSAIA